MIWLTFLYIEFLAWLGSHRYGHGLRRDCEVKTTGLANGNRMVEGGVAINECILSIQESLGHGFYPFW